MSHKAIIVDSGTKKVRLADFDPRYTAQYENKEAAKAKAEALAEEIGQRQKVLSAQGLYGVLVLLHGPDGAGKSTLAQHLVSRTHVAGSRIESFKAPTPHEISCGYLHRHIVAGPRRGFIMIHDRCWYEAVDVLQVHPEFLATQRFPPKPDHGTYDFWAMRYEEIKNIERYYTQNGFAVVKFYLHLSQEEQTKRLRDRLVEEDKHFKCSMSDLKEREFFDEHRKAVERAITHTATNEAPWYILPADRKWAARALACDIMLHRMDALGLEYPEADPQTLEAFKKALAA